MEDPKALVKTLLTNLNNEELKKDISKVVTQHKERSLMNRNTLNELSIAINSLTRENAQIEAEIQQLALTQSKNNDIYTKKNGERYKMALKLIDLEQKNEEIESGIQELANKISIKEEELQNINSPSAEMLYYEIIRRFGVSFTNKEGITYVRIKNRDKNDVYEIGTNEGSVEEICDRIWELIA